jgi:CheY-like chemotaxis protein
MIHLLLINLTPEAEWVAWRAAQHVWGRCVSVQSAPDIHTAVNILLRTAPFEQSPCPSLALLAIGAHGDCDPETLEELRNASSSRAIPLVGLADTSRAVERLQARHAPFDGIILNPVQPNALRELAQSLDLKQPLSATI